MATSLSFTTATAVQVRVAPRASAPARAPAAAARPLPLAAPARAFAAPPARHRRSVRAFGWGDPVEWAECQVVSTAPAAEGLTSLVVDLGARAAGYTAPGQYCQFRVGEDSKPAFIAIASAPGQPVELLVKAQGGTSDQLCRLRAGDRLECSPVMGGGFPLDQAPPADFDTLLLFATGSGISPVRACIESGALRAAERKAVKLYYGVRGTAFDPVKER